MSSSRGTIFQVPSCKSWKRAEGSSGISQTKRATLPLQNQRVCAKPYRNFSGQKVSQRRSTITVGICPAWDSLLVGLRGQLFGTAVRQYHGNAEYSETASERGGWGVQMHALADGQGVPLNGRKPNATLSCEYALLHAYRGVGRLVLASCGIWRVT
jgi:hypothetical protein